MQIDKKAIEQMFTDMRGRAPWNVDGPLLWGYFFFGETDKLKAMAASLCKVGYRLVGIHQKENGPSLLHVERVEVHTPDTLDGRNQELDGVAKRFGVDYDGFDVGAPPSSA
jgi:hypothetical protein